VAMANSMRVATGVALLLAAAVALALTLQPYGSYFRTDNPGEPGSPAAFPTKCPSVVHGVPKDRPAPVGGFGVQGASGCHPGGPVREALAIPEGIAVVLGLGLLVTAARRRVAASVAH
jgi:hypothetical protein